MSSPRVRTALGILALVVALTQGLSAITLLGDSRWVYASVSAALAVFLALTSYGYLTGRRTMFSGPTPIDPAEVPSADVERAVAENSTEVAAIKALRSVHRRLSLVDAVRLVREETARRA